MPYVISARVFIMIPGLSEKHKRLLDETLIPLIVILVAVIAFGLGRLSALEAEKTGLIIHESNI